VTLNRRDFVKGVATVPIPSASSISIESSGELVNDVHTGLNPTAAGILQVESGIAWPELLRGYLALQTQQPVWGIQQKQGGADRMAEALSANAHGHCLDSPPIIADVEWIEIVTAQGKVERCDRNKNRELFTLAIGGYGLFGIITTVGLCLARRTKLRRRASGTAIINDSTNEWSAAAYL
jgi:hypothetical protein